VDGVDAFRCGADGVVPADEPCARLSPVADGGDAGESVRAAGGAGVAGSVRAAVALDVDGAESGRGIAVGGGGPEGFCAAGADDVGGVDSVRAGGGAGRPASDGLGGLVA
jgi:hypothetical protein